MKYALIGCGRISPNHIEAAKNNGLEISAICDLLPERTQEKATMFGLPESVKQYTDYKQMLREVKPQLVAIATESGEHAHIALDCINAGCSVIIEKPIALSMADARAIVAAGHEKGVVVCTCHQNRFNKSVRKLREMQQNGGFGKLLHGAAHILWNRGPGYYEQAKWRGTWAQDGGTLMNQCIHNIDLLRWIMGGEVEEVFAYTDNLLHPYIEAEDLGLAVVKFKNGAYGMIQGTANVYPRNLEETLYIFGEHATVKLGGKSDNIIEEWKLENDPEGEEFVKANFHEDPPNVYGFGHTPLYENVISAIEQGCQPGVTAEDGMRALELVLAIYKSAATGAPVKLPLQDCSTMEFADRFKK